MNRFNKQLKIVIVASIITVGVVGGYLVVGSDRLGFLQDKSDIPSVEQQIAPHYELFKEDVKKEVGEKSDNVIPVSNTFGISSINSSYTGKIVTVPATIIKVSTGFGKKQQKTNAFMTAVDPNRTTNTISVVLFDIDANKSNYDILKKSFEQKKPVEIKGKIDQYKGELEIIVYSVTPL